MLKLRRWVQKGEKKVKHKQKEREKVSPEEEERRKEFVCWMMEPVQKQKTWRTSSTATGTKEMTTEEDREKGDQPNEQEEPTAMDTSESERDIPRRETSRRSRPPSPERWREELEPGEK